MTRLKDGLAALNAAGSRVTRLSLVGGGARSAFWAQQLASALDAEVVTHGSLAVGGALVRRAPGLAGHRCGPKHRVPKPRSGSQLPPHAAERRPAGRALRAVPQPVPPYLKSASPFGAFNPLFNLTTQLLNLDDGTYEPLLFHRLPHRL